MVKQFLDSNELKAFLKSSYPIQSYLDGVLEASPDLRCHFDIVKMASTSLGEGARILDLGAGGLDKVLPLAEMGFECSAFDDYRDPWHQSSFELISDLASRHNINLVTGSLQDLASGWNLGHYDMIMLNDVIEHLHFSPVALIDNCVKNLNNGGFIVVNVPSCVNIKKRIKCLFGYSIYPPADQFFSWQGEFRGHVREYSRQDLEFIASNISGFSSWKVNSVSHMIGVVPAFARSIAKLMFFVFPSLSDSWQLILRK